MNFRSINLHYYRWFVLLHFVVQSLGLNTDGILLLSFKYSVLRDPLSVLQNWNYEDDTPCSWTGVMCIEFPYPGVSDTFHVVALYLPNSQLLGSIPADLGMIEHLRHIDLSNNFLNGSLPDSLFDSSELKILSLSNNVISGELPEFIGGLKNLQFLNLSDNALTGKINPNLASLLNLTVLSLSKNYFFGEVPSGFDSVEVLDLSFNLINGTLPSDFSGENLNYLNLSYNKLSGEIPLEFAKRIPFNATVDLSFNNLTGEIPKIETFRSQKAESFVGNPNLCGKPLKNPCLIPSTLSPPPPNNSSISTATTSPPAYASIPKPIDSSPRTATNEIKKQRQSGLKPAIIAGIIAGNLVGIGIVSIIFLYVYQSKKKKKKEQPSSTNSSGFVWPCLNKKGANDEETSETSEEEEEEEEVKKKEGSLVIVDGETELELETLFKASAYIIGASGSSIVYKAVMEDGTTFAVRRIGECGVDRYRFKDFENHVRFIAKLRHPNLVRIRGFYWGSDEKLVIYDHVPNGNLANVSYKKLGSSPYHLSWEARLRIARGVARGLTYLHEKKHVHGNLKPSNILLGLDMEPRISDFGLEKLVWGDNSKKADGSARNFGSNRSTTSHESLQDLQIGASPSTSSIMGASHYHAPESLKNLKSNPKWDVYSFGVLLLELLSGKTILDKELGQWGNELVLEDGNRVIKMVDLAIRADVQGKEDTLSNCFKLGFSCVSVVQQRRPTMKEVLQVLEKIPSP